MQQELFDLKPFEVIKTQAQQAFEPIEDDWGDIYDEYEDFDVCSKSWHTSRNY